jgi:carboxylesterase type B
VIEYVEGIDAHLEHVSGFDRKALLQRHIEVVPTGTEGSFKRRLRADHRGSRQVKRPRIKLVQKPASLDGFTRKRKVRSFRIGAGYGRLAQVGSEYRDTTHLNANLKIACGGPEINVIHSAELGYVFGTFVMGKPGPVDPNIAADLQPYSTNFAKSGDPNGQSLPAWTRHDSVSQAYLEFTDDGPVEKTKLRNDICHLYEEALEKR